MGTTGDEQLAVGGTAATIYNMTVTAFFIPLLQTASIFESCGSDTKMQTELVQP